MRERRAETRRPSKLRVIETECYGYECREVRDICALRVSYELQGALKLGPF